MKNLGEFPKHKEVHLTSRAKKILEANKDAVKRKQAEANQYLKKVKGEDLPIEQLPSSGARLWRP